MTLSRRDLMKLGGLGALGAAGLSLPFGREVSGSAASLLPTSLMPRPYRAAFSVPPVAKPYKTVTDLETGKPKHYYDVWAMKGTAKILPTLTTAVMGYNWSETYGTAPGYGRVPGPLIKVNQGEKVVLTMHNQLTGNHPLYGKPINISTHLHGSASLPQYDGYASDITAPGMKKYYHYPNFQSARTMWYHDHGVHYTAENAYSGLAAQYHLSDAQERALLPQGEFDVPITLTDIQFNANGSMMYDDRSHSGLWGDVILVNGQPWPVMKVKRAVYRFRILNASIARSYRPTTSPAAPMYMVATDGGLMPKAEQVSQWRHAGSERYEVLIDFRKFAPGQRIALNNLSNDNNRDYDHTGKIMAFDVIDSPIVNFTIPGVLNTTDEAMNLVQTSRMKVRELRVQRDNSTWSINGRTWNHVVASGYKEVVANPALGDTEVWNITNNSGGWFHPMHIHMVDFKILSRNGLAPKAYEKGPKDTVYVGEGETVKLIMKFGKINPDASKGEVKNVGKYMIHCHNLPHEDHDMMSQFSVGLTDTTTDPNDPIEADKPRDESDNSGQD